MIIPFLKFFLYLIFYLGIFTEIQPSKVRMRNNNNKNKVKINHASGQEGT